MARKGKKRQVAVKFPVGSEVRVKAGTKDPDFPDIPLGGWTGKVKEVYEDETPPVYLVEWDHYTLRNMHPVYKSRCERENLDPESMGLNEDDLEPDRGEPATIEQPTALASRPLDPDDQEDRVRAVLGVKTRDEPLPRVDTTSLRRYYKHLVTHLTFPFTGQLGSPIGPHQNTRTPLKVIRLLDVDTYSPEEMYGLICKAEQGGERIELPLDRIDVEVGDPNKQPVDDYSFWLANWA